MPLYEFLCVECGRRKTAYRKVDDRNKGEYCSCLSPMQRVISAPHVQGEITPYFSPKTGKLISSRAQHRDDLARSGCRVLEPGMKKDIERTRQERIRAFDEKMDHNVSKIAGELAASGRI